MTNYFEDKLKGLTGGHILLIGVFILAYIAVYPMFVAEEPFFLGMSHQFWLLLPLIIPLFGWLYYSKIQPELETKEIILEDAFVLAKRFYHSDTRQFMGLSPDIAFTEYIPNFRTGDYLFFFRDALDGGTKKILLLDGRKSSGNPLVYGVMNEDQMQSFGCKNYFDIFRKFGRVEGEQSPIDKALSVLDQEQVTAVLTEKPEYLLSKGKEASE